jgi:hypothetical protein
MLSNTSLEIHNRKGELTVVKVELYLKSITKIARSKSHNFYEVMTDKNPNIVGQEMFDSINEFNLDCKFLIREGHDKQI